MNNIIDFALIKCKGDRRKANRHSDLVKLIEKREKFMELGAEPSVLNSLDLMIALLKK